MHAASQRRHDAPAQQFRCLMLMLPVVTDKHALALTIPIQGVLVTVRVIAWYVLDIVSPVELVPDVVRKGTLLVRPLEVPVFASWDASWAIFPSLEHVLGTLTGLGDDEASVENEIASRVIISFPVEIVGHSH